MDIIKCSECGDTMKLLSEYPNCDTYFKCENCGKSLCKSPSAVYERKEPAPKIVEPHKQRWFAMHLGLIKPMLDVFTVNKDSGRYPEFSHMGKFENGREELFDAMMRHVEASQENPLAKDEKTGCYHLACVASNALMRLHDALLETPNQEAS